jgi:hypothetical protein
LRIVAACFRQAVEFIHLRINLLVGDGDHHQFLVPGSWLTVQLCPRTKNQKPKTGLTVQEPETSTPECLSKNEEPRTRNPGCPSKNQ